MLEISADNVGPIQISVRLKRIALPSATGVLSRDGRLVFEWTPEGLRARADSGPSTHEASGANVEDV